MNIKDSVNLQTTCWWCDNEDLTNALYLYLGGHGYVWQCKSCRPVVSKAEVEVK